MKALKLIGLTGGIASGKSTVAKWLSEAGFLIVNLDDLGRKLTDSNPSVIQAIDRLCGGGVLKNGKLDRAKARAIVFKHPELKKQLEAILHPLILAEFLKIAQSAEQQGKDAIVCEAALLFESGFYKKCDTVILVTVDPESQKARVLNRDAISTELAERMINSQWPDAKKEKQSHYTLRNDGSLETLKKQVIELIPKLLSFEALQPRQGSS